MLMEKLFAMNGAPCSCGRPHRFSAKILSGRGVISRLPEEIRGFGAGKVFLLADLNTWEAAGKRVSALLTEAGIAVQSCVLPEKEPHPDEKRVGTAVMHMDRDCEAVLGVGSGVVNDLGKLVAAHGRLPYLVVATAPSMDGYASATSSMVRDGLKVTVPTKAPEVILGDAEILMQAPERLLRAGLGDMIAKYVSICEWRMASLITGEYYCPAVADLIRSAVGQCVRQAEGLLRREENAVMAVFRGLVVGGVAMDFAGCSRPASGAEHYISHVLDMRGVEFGLPTELHGIQCAVGTAETVRLYEKLKGTVPDREKAVAYAENFRYDLWSAQLRRFLGRGAESMIALEEKEKKYDPAAHKTRLDRIVTHWQALTEILRQELPPSRELEDLLRRVGLPVSLEELGVESALRPTVVEATRDIRDKYVLSRLLWDLGITEEVLA